MCSEYFVRVHMVEFIKMGDTFKKKKRCMPIYVSSDFEEPTAKRAGTGDRGTFIPPPPPPSLPWVHAYGTIYALVYRIQKVMPKGTVC